MKVNSEILVSDLEAHGFFHHHDQTESKDRFQHTSPLSVPDLKNRLGLISLCLLTASLAVIVFGIAFLNYVWFAGPENDLWRYIVVHNWASRVVSFTSTGIRWAIGTQTATCLAMSAALALEKYLVPHPDVATVSMMRIGGSDLVGTVRDLIFPLVARGPRQSHAMWTIVVTTIGILLTSTVLQFTSTLLLSDLAQISVPGLPSEYKARIDAAYIVESGPGYLTASYLYDSDPISSAFWAVRRPAAYPGFAEYTEVDSEIKRDNVSDTGVTMRAYLPFTNAIDRDQLREYRGKAVVVDSRVTCVQPEVANLWIFSTDNSEYTALQGTVTPSLSLPHINAPQAAVNFSCWSSQQGEEYYSICELANSAVLPYDGVADALGDSFSGGLYSGLRESAANVSGAAYVIMSNMPQNGGEWTSVSLPEIPGADLDNWTILTGAYYNPYLTLCYAALDSADRDIVAYSQNNRTEAEAWLDGDTFNYTEVVNQLGTGPIEDRSLMSLKLAANEIWKHPYSMEDFTDGPAIINEQSISLPFLVNYLHLRTNTDHYEDQATVGNLSFVMTENDPGDNDLVISSQPWTYELWSALIANYSVARTLQGILTTYAGLIYYDIDYTARYDHVVPVTTTSFGWHIGPAKYYTIGYRKHQYTTKVPPFLTMVLLVIAIHHALVTVVVLRFWRETRLSRLGDPWQAVAHVVSGGETEIVLTASGSVDADRETAKRRWNEAGLEHVCVGIGETKGHTVALTRENGQGE